MTHLSTELTTQPTASIKTRVSKWVSNHLPIRRNRTAPGTEQQRPEHKAILRVTPQLLKCLQRNPNPIYPSQLRDHLFAKKVISESNHKALIQCSTASIAVELMRVIAERIELSNGHFYELIDALQSEEWAQDILKILKTARDTL